MSLLNDIYLHTHIHRYRLQQLQPIHDMQQQIYRTLDNDRGLLKKKRNVLLNRTDNKGI